MWHTYEFRNKLGALVQDRQGNTGTIQLGKLKAWQIKAKESALTELHGIKCTVLLTKTEGRI
jgi:hypothetical protein